MDESAFEELRKLAALNQGAKSCTKRPYTLGRAKEAARARNALETGGRTTWSALPCYGDCGGQVFHVTTSKVKPRQASRFELGVTPRVFDAAAKKRHKKARKRGRWRRNRELHQAAVATWEDEGGALDPRETED